jgi:N-acetyltransferase 10
MVRKKLDDRIRTLIERGVVTNQRSILVLVGDHGKDQVPNLHHILSKCTFAKRPSVLWCYKKELGFSTHKQKRIKKLKRDKQRGLLDAEAGVADSFELFISQTDITWCYYKDSHRVLGTTVGVLVLQDFEALTPNLMARTIETVQGGGLVIFLMRTVKSLKQLYTLSMDVHARYRTESAADIVPRFNERFILSMGKCPNCLVCDDELNVLPISKKHLKSLPKVDKAEAGQVIVKELPGQQELEQLQETLADTPHVGVLVELTKTLDQAKALLVFLEVCSEKTLHSTTVAMTAARGRGKSAAMGLCLAGALSLGFSTICVTAPEPENLVAVFDFICRGLKALKYQEHMDYTVTYNNSSGRDQTKCVVSVQIHRSHRQLVQYVAPSETDKFASAEIVAIDEAAAIPLPIVRALMKHTNRLSFLSSTVNGYEGTGRALSLKLIKELRDSKGGRHAEMLAANTAAGQVIGAKSNKGEAKVHEQRWKAAAAAVEGNGDKLSGALREIELSTPIRYAPGDPVESWLNKLLCLDCGSSSSLRLSGGAPAPGDCELYSVDRDALFSYHKLSEAFLQKVMGLYTSAHYKNTPNDLQMLSDAPAHNVFVLLSPSAEKDSNSLPDVLCVVQVALEGKISRKVVEAQLARGHRSAGDLIPWTLSQQFGDSKFAQLSGARVVRIAVHPSVQGMGYGSRAMELLYRFYNGEMISIANLEVDESGSEEEPANRHQEESEESEDDASGTGIYAERMKPRNELPPLLLPLTEVDAPKLDWLGTSFGLTLGLHKFWSSAGMRMLYLRQTKNELTGEHSAIMIRTLPKRTGVDDAWLYSFLVDVRRRFIALLGGPFKDLDIRLSVSVLDCVNDRPPAESLLNTAGRSGASVGKITSEELDYFLAPHDLKRLEQYGRNLCDHHLVTDLLPAVSRLYFTGRLGNDFSLSSVQSALLCGIGLQSRTVDDLTAELGLPSNQVLAMFNKAIRKISIGLNAIVEAKEKQALLTGEKRQEAEQAAVKMRDVARQTLEEDANDAATDAMQALKDSNESSLPREIVQDPELMQYAVKGSDEQWKQLLKGKDVTAAGTVQIQDVREKRKAVDDADIENEAIRDGTLSQSARKSSKGSKTSKKKGKKSRRSM